MDEVVCMEDVSKYIRGLRKVVDGWEMYIVGGWIDGPGKVAG